MLSYQFFLTFDCPSGSPPSPHPPPPPPHHPHPLQSNPGTAPPYISFGRLKKLPEKGGEGGTLNLP